MERDKNVEEQQCRLKEERALWCGARGKFGHLRDLCPYEDPLWMEVYYRARALYRVLPLSGWKEGATCPKAEEGEEWPVLEESEGGAAEPEGPRRGSRFELQATAGIPHTPASYTAGGQLGRLPQCSQGLELVPECPTLLSALLLPAPPLLECPALPPLPECPAPLPVLSLPALLWLECPATLPAFPVPTLPLQDGLATPASISAASIARTGVFPTVASIATASIVSTGVPSVAMTGARHAAARTGRKRAADYRKGGGGEETTSAHQSSCHPCTPIRC
ncbi:UNVERIFIED_CONTAM: hypothetical protein FKN15_027924 [Acipenser sinensis]